MRKTGILMTAAVIATLAGASAPAYRGLWRDRL